MLKTFTQVRAYFHDCTVSDLYGVDGEKLGHALEDVGRPHGVKIPGETCIPEGIYNVVITNSPKYGKDMIQLYNVDDYSVQKYGVRFDGIRVHGGNDVDDSEGCPLVAENFDGDAKIWKSISGQLTEQVKQLIAQGHDVRWIITSD